MEVAGIDLGTSNSAIALADDDTDGVSVVGVAGTQTTMPSVVGCSEDGSELFAGDRAVALMKEDPQRAFYSLKRLAGRSRAELEDEGLALPFDIVDGPTGDMCPIYAGRTFDVPMLLSKVVSSMKESAEDALGKSLEHAVVAVPVRFGDHRRIALREAVELSGLNVLGVIDEPAAAALAYGINGQDHRTCVLVFDLGGGTLDVSVVEMFVGVYQVYGIAGDMHLGGDDWDEAVTKYLESCVYEGAVSDEMKERNLPRIRLAAEELKIALSTQDEASCEVMLTDESGSVQTQNVELTRDKLNELTAPLLERCAAVVHQAIENSHIEVADIEEVVLVGGGSRIPAIREMLKQITGITPRESVDPTEAVAIGAAIQAAVLVNRKSRVLLMDSTALSNDSRKLMWDIAVMPCFPR